ncbi:hypothetical protein ACFV0O_04420 [Kitasatospora sp. NPDC059577]|uniref:hypothetical protein n=1 Tax=Kitasatospora sp. NPDC059577 TaxID=3346873 RepID=UPI0036813207
MSAGGPEESVDQVVFRWKGNQGRRSSGMAATAWSCSPERADDLSRELAPLLRVDGAARPSLVRTLTKRGEAAVIRRWPTTDAGGRPNTACHLLLGDQDLLGPRLALALYGWPFGSQEFAETTTGRCGRVEYALLADTAKEAWPDTPSRIGEVTDALTVAVAALLRRPGARLSLRADSLPGWPDRNRSAAVIRGLYEIFGRDWLGQPWTFATYDVTDRHDLAVTWVTDWTTDAGHQGARSRVDPRRSESDFAHTLAARMVELVLERPVRAPGLSELHANDLRDAATLSTAERLRRLSHVLGVDRGSRPRPGRTEPPRPEDTRPGRRDDDRRPTADHRPAEHHPLDHGPLDHDPEPPSPAPDGNADRHDDSDDSDDRGVYTDPPADHRPPPSLRTLRRELDDPAPTKDILPRLVGLSTGIGDGPLLDLLREEDLSGTATKRLLFVLCILTGSRPPEDCHLLCAEVLRQQLYLYRSDRAPQGEHDAPDDQLVERAAWLFGWAVAPYTREPRHEQALITLFDQLQRDSSAVEQDLLRRLVPPPESNDPSPDLPTRVWQRLVYPPPTTPPRAQPQPQPQPKPQPHPEPETPPLSPTPQPPTSPPPAPTEPDPPPITPPPGPRHATPPRSPHPTTPPDPQTRNVRLVLGISAALIAILVIALALA